MTQQRKRRRERYVLVDWQPGLQDVRPARSTPVECRAAVVSGDVVQWVESPGLQGMRLAAVADKQQVHGHWLPARVVLDGSRFRFVVDVDLVPHTTPAQHERQLRRVRDAVAAGDVRSLAQPATWSRLFVINGTDRVAFAEHLTQRYTLQVTTVAVLPLPSRPGRRGQRAIDASVLVAPKDLLRAALDATQLHGVLRPAQRRNDVGTLTARQRPVPSGRQRTERTLHTDELLARVRDVHQAAPHGGKLQAVMQHFGFELRKAQQLVSESQDAHQWGLRHERSRQSRQRHKKGSKT